MLSSSVSSLARHATRRTALPTIGAVRNLNVHEYISMEIMKEHGIAIPEGYVASTPEEAENQYLKGLQHTGQGHKDGVIKAQVLSGGRGLGHFKNGFQGGVHMVTKPGQAREFASQMLGQELVTKQAPNGILCSKVYMMERMYMRKEMYLSILMDRASQGPLMVASPRGGTSIEDVAASNPEVIFTQPIDIVEGLTEEQCDHMASNLGLEKGTAPYEKAVKLMKNLYDMFISCDCTQVEINPLAETPDGDIVVCDAKVNFDDNAEYRQKTIFDRRDYSQEDPREVEASKYDLNYIGLDGNIGCMVNGAGLAMSTMDIIQLKGGSPANFLDVGGGATEAQVQKGFEILNNDSNVKAILVNIFGGIMKCDVIANGIINAAKEIGIRKPIVIRLQGTNVEKAKLLIEGCGFKMILANDLEDAATKAVGVADIAAQAEKIAVDVKFESFDL
jgi:succinyl-CoA synthetase beta subunit